MQETQETQVRSLGREDPLKKETASHSSTLAWKIPWTEEPGGLQSTGLQRVGHDGRDLHAHHSNLRDTGSPLNMNLRVGTFKDVNVYLHVESRKLVHMSGVHFQVHPSMSFCFCVLHCTVLYRIQ